MVVNARNIVCTLLESVSIEQGITENDLAQVKAILDVEFERHLHDSWAYITKNTDWSISFKALDGTKIVGVYALGNNQIASEFDLPDYRERKGVEGVALAVLPEYKGTGVGRQLIEAPRKLGRDYVWGSALRALSNVQHWAKRRKIVGEKNPGAKDNYYVSVEDYK